MVGESCLTSQNVCTYPLPCDLASAKKIKIHLDLIRAALTGLEQLRMSHLILLPWRDALSFLYTQLAANPFFQPVLCSAGSGVGIK